MKRAPLNLGVLLILIGLCICESNADNDNTLGEETTEYRTVETNSGKIRGIKKFSSLNEIPFYSFKGIRYAKPPIGDLRFKAPVPIDPWTDTIDAFEHISGCMRTNNPPFKDRLQNDDDQSEDCLALNIYVPDSASADNKLPVLFVIHGAFFIGLSGNTDTLGPDYLIEQDIIIVTLNYRLGILGFLSLNATEYSGNMGLKDQQLALKWIYENVEQFYGDQKKITVLGYSGGAASAHFHVLSDESKKYIDKAILSSGTAASIWAMSDTNDHSALIRSLSPELKDAKKKSGLLNILKTMPANKLMALTLPKITFYNTLDFAFAPVIERANAVRPFMVRDPMEAYKDSNITATVLFSVTQSEMSAFYNTYSLLYPQFSKMNKNFKLKLPFRQSIYAEDAEDYHEMTFSVRGFYFDDKKVGPKTSQEYIDMISDLNFDYPYYKSIKAHAKYAKGPAFAMRFSVNATMNWMKRVFADKTLHAEHGSDACYTFHCHQYSYHSEVFQHFKSEESRVSRQTMRIMTRLFSNFVKHGHPTYNNDLIAHYQPVECFSIHSLDITNDGPTLQLNTRKDQLYFWEQLEKQALGVIPVQKYKYLE